MKTKPFVLGFLTLRRIIAVLRVKTSRKQSEKNQPETDGFCSHVMEHVCIAKKDKGQSGRQVRHYRSPQSYTSTTMLHHSIGGPSFIGETTISVRMDHYNNLYGKN